MGSKSPEYASTAEQPQSGPSATYQPSGLFEEYLLISRAERALGESNVIREGSWRELCDAKDLIVNAMMRADVETDQQVFEKMYVWRVEYYEHDRRGVSLAELAPLSAYFDLMELVGAQALAIEGDVEIKKQLKSYQFSLMHEENRRGTVS